MRTDGMWPPDLRALTSLVTSCKNIRLVAELRELFLVLDEARITPDVILWVALLEACMEVFEDPSILAKLLDAALHEENTSLQHFRNFQQMNPTVVIVHASSIPGVTVVPNDHFLVTIMLALKKLNRFAEGNQIMARMQIDWNIKLGEESMNRFLLGWFKRSTSELSGANATVSADHVDWAESLLRAASGGHFKHNLGVNSKLLIFWAKANRHDRALDELHKLHTSGIVIPVQAFVDLFYNTRRQSRAPPVVFKIFDSMALLGYNVDLSLATSYVKTLLEYLPADISNAQDFLLNHWSRYLPHHSTPPDYFLTEVLKSIIASPISSKGAHESVFKRYPWLRGRWNAPRRPTLLPACEFFNHFLTKYNVWQLHSYCHVNAVLLVDAAIARQDCASIDWFLQRGALFVGIISHIDAKVRLLISPAQSRIDEIQPQSVDKPAQSSSSVPFLFNRFVSASVDVSASQSSDSHSTRSIAKSKDATRHARSVLATIENKFIPGYVTMPFEK
jgi:hypothetical protein